jgi:phage baseplate assembly protein W
MNDQDFNPILGRGWSFPPEFNRSAAGVEMVTAVQDINQSLNILLSTSLGERVMQPQYGCDLHDYLFDPMNSTVIGFIRDLVTNAIMFFEPRIVAERIEVTSADSFDLIEGRFTISVEYMIPGSNSRFNYVYDYYLNEAFKTI